ncbi:hypothetical protein M0813_20314 [Anaeramoeba flamelloides]|uniref:Uncharacterized protein n=1 Tax=Anaeramoeba flamelloides TaxID=1746091 RepID=A0ABQ8YL87_9EUKA|nr:hypothetical protein M0813_20314 [Anaeramoeba flamelloides]
MRDYYSFKMVQKNKNTNKKTILHDASSKRQNLKLEQNHLQDVKDEDYDEKFVDQFKKLVHVLKSKDTILGQPTWKLGHKYVVHLISFFKSGLLLLYIYKPQFKILTNKIRL